MPNCVNCGGNEFDNDPITGEDCCIQCGAIVKNVKLVAEVEFVENGTSSKAVGGFVATTDTNDFGLLKPSQDSCVYRIREYMLRIASILSLNNNFVDSALTFYKMALHNNLTRARKTENVAVACLYMCCRLEKTSHLLMDFTDAVKADIFTLGKTFLFLTKSLSINLPVVDPCLYIQRYGHKLNMGDKTHEICYFAVKIVSRMKRDWIQYGRRPSGLCGAALLVSAKLHNVTISIKKIVQVVRISSSVLVKRLKDFSSTPSANLTFEEFKNMDTKPDDFEADPPSFVNGQNVISKRKNLEEVMGKELTPEILDHVSKTKREIEVLMGLRKVIQVGLNDASYVRNLFNINGKNKKYEKEMTTFVFEEDPEKIIEASKFKPLEVKENVFCQPTEVKQIEEEICLEEGLSDLDDYEIENCILTPIESMYKKKIWEAENDDFLLEREKKKSEKLEEIKKKNMFKRKRKIRKKHKEDSQGGFFQAGNEVLNNESKIEKSSIINNDVRALEAKKNMIDNGDKEKISTSEMIDNILKTGKYKRRGNIHLKAKPNLNL